MSPEGSHAEGGSEGRDLEAADGLIEGLDQAITSEELDRRIAEGRRHLESGGARYREVEQAVERARLRREEM